MSLKNKKTVVGMFLFLLLISIPLTLYTLRQHQNVNSKAAASTTLDFQPTSSSTAPIQKNVNDTINLDLMVNPTNSLVSFIKFQVKYDPTKVQPITTDPFTLNLTAFPAKIEGPVINTDTMAESVSIGSDPTKAIQTTTKVGTLNFKAVGATNGTPTSITFTNITQVLSAGPNEQASQNVLSTTTPAYITIGNNGQPTATPSAGTPAPTAVSTILTLNLLLHGVGAAGDNPNPGGATLSNKDPLHPQRDVKIEIINSNNEVVKTAGGDIIYSADDGSFIGTYDLGANFPEGNYNIKVKTPRYLRRLVPGIQKIKPLTINTIDPTGMVAGDVNDDNILNVLDYNALLDCGYGAIEPLPIEDAHATFHSANCQVHTPVDNIDIDDNGIVNSADYNLFLRELSVQSGD